MEPVTVTVPGLAVKSELNQREPWQAAYRRKKAQRKCVGVALLVLIPAADRRTLSASPSLCVTMTRLYTGRAKALDEGDNLESSMKATRDEIAAFLGRGDDARAGIVWRVLQERGDETGVRIEFQCLADAAGVA